ncbi:MAG: hypothetical protein ACI80V_000011 [Rhodothermales bacterium]|jgi:hypothetical protein
MLKTNPTFVDALVASVIDLLQKGRPVHLPGVGTLSVEHQPATGATDRAIRGKTGPADSGPTLPADTIGFVPETV